MEARIELEASDVDFPRIDSAAPVDAADCFATARLLGLNPLVVGFNGQQPSVCFSVLSGVNQAHRDAISSLWAWAHAGDSEHKIRGAYARDVWAKRPSGMMIVELG